MFSINNSSVHCAQSHIERLRIRENKEPRYDDTIIRSQLYLRRPPTPARPPRSGFVSLSPVTILFSIIIPRGSRVKTTVKINSELDDDMEVAEFSLRHCFLQQFSQSMVVIVRLRSPNHEFGSVIWVSKTPCPVSQSIIH